MSFVVTANQAPVIKDITVEINDRPANSLIMGEMFNKIFLQVYGVYPTEIYYSTSLLLDYLDYECREFDTEI